MAVSPRTPRMLKIFEPMIFPIEMELSFLMAAMSDAANSGILVPTATTVTPITRSETPNCSATLTAPLINNSEPK